jgi:hypothetical protein
MRFPHIRMLWMVPLMFLATCLLAQTPNRGSTVDPNLADKQSSIVVVPRDPAAADRPLIPYRETLYPVETAPLRDIAAAAEFGPQPVMRMGPRFVVQSSTDYIPRMLAQPQLPAPASNLPPGGLAATLGLSFEGLGTSFAVKPFQVGTTPPDMSGAAGLTQYVQFVNFSLAVFNKADGQLLAGPMPLSMLWTDAKVGGPCSQMNSGDPIVQYDKLANRWLITQLATIDPLKGPYFECMAVSKTSDATGNFFLFQQEFVKDPNSPPGPNNPPVFNDFPKFGIMPDAYYASYNSFMTINNQFTATGEIACAYDRNAMLNGDQTPAICIPLPFFTVGADTTLLPADLDGTTLPPTGTPGYYLGIDFSTSSLNIYRFHPDFNNHSNSTFDNRDTRIVIAPTPGVDNFFQVCFDLGVNCITQPAGADGTMNTLDAMSDRPSYRFAYRNFGDHESFVLTHTVEGAAQDTNEPTDVAWWELRKTGNASPVIFQDHANFDRTPGPGANINRWLSSVAMDKVGNMLMGYSISAGTDQNDSTIQIHPSIGLAGRSITDPVGTTKVLDAPGEVVVAGGGSLLTQQSHRWGDYSQMTVDPVDDCTFWYTNEYITVDTKDDTPKWSTRILNAKFPTCASTPDFSILPNPGSRSIAVGTNTTYTVNVSAMNGFAGNVALSLSGLPSDLTGTFNPTTISGGGSSTLTISAPSSFNAADVIFNITGTSGTKTLTGAPGNISHSSTVALQINDFSLTATPTDQKLAPGNIASYTIGLDWTKPDFSDPVSLSVSGQPQFSTVTFTPASITQGQSSTLTIATDPSTAVGVYTLTVTGTHASGLKHNLILHLDLTDFTASATPAAQSTGQGGSTTYTVSIADVMSLGFNDNVTLSLDPSTLPAGVQGTFAPNPVHGLGSSMLTVTTTSATPLGTTNLTIKGTDGADVHTTNVSLTVTSPAPAVCFSPTSLTFAAQNVGTTSAPQPVTLTNCGTASLSITSIGVTGDFGQTNNCPASLAVNANCTVNVTFTPSTTGMRPGALNVSDNASGSPHSVSLSGTGSLPAVSLTPSSLTFPGQNVGTASAPQKVTLANNGTGLLSISSIVITGDFSQTNTCGSSVAAGSSCMISVTSTPTTTGPRSGTLSVNDNAAGSPQTVSLSGTGTVPGATLSSATLTFPAQSIGSTSAAQTITVTNNGTGLLSIASIATTGDFAQTSNCGSTLVAGANCSINVTFTPTITGSRNGTLMVTDNASGSPQSVALSGTGTSAGFSFVPVAPCRVADTRNPNGPFGGPFLAAGTTRGFNVPGSACGIPSTAKAYSVNVTVVPKAKLGFLTLFPCGQNLPPTSTLNSDGRVKAAAAIVPAGTNGGACAFTTDDTDFILDIDGYFVSSTNTSALEFYPLTPCRVVDTRNPAGPLGGPPLVGNATRTFPVLSSSCNVPNTAKAYSLNYTSVPKGSLGFLTTWPAGQTQPVVSTLNAPTGTVTANAAIVPAGTNGDINVFVSNDSDLVVDINGYFAPPAQGGLSLFPVTPCRALDTRNPAGSPPFNGKLDVNIGSSSCAPSASAKAFVLNATVVPPGPLGFLTLWPQGAPQPVASTLNANDGAITSNLAIVPTTNGSISAFVSQPSHLILDISGFFAP